LSIAKESSFASTKTLVGLKIKKNIEIPKLQFRCYICIAYNRIYNKNAYRKKIEMSGTCRTCIEKNIISFHRPLDWSDPLFLKVMEPD
jgi:hypothetical protein